MQTVTLLAAKDSTRHMKLKDDDQDPIDSEDDCITRVNKKLD